MREYRHLENIVDADWKEGLVTLKKTGREKIYITAHRKTFVRVPVLLVYSQDSESINHSIYGLLQKYKSSLAFGGNAKMPTYF